MRVEWSDRIPPKLVCFDPSKSPDPRKRDRIPLGSPADPHPDPPLSTPEKGSRNLVCDPPGPHRGPLRWSSGAPCIAHRPRHAAEPPPELLSWSNFQIIPTYLTVCNRQSGKVGTICGGSQGRVARVPVSGAPSQKIPRPRVAGCRGARLRSAGQSRARSMGGD